MELIILVYKKIAQIIRDIIKPSKAGSYQEKLYEATIKGTAMSFWAFC